MTAKVMLMATIASRTRHLQTGQCYLDLRSPERVREKIAQVPATSCVREALSKASASCVFRPTWLAKLSNACTSWPRFHCTTNCAPRPPPLVPSRSSSTHTRATRSGALCSSAALGESIEPPNRALSRRAARDHVSRLAKTTHAPPPPPPPPSSNSDFSATAASTCCRARAGGARSRLWRNVVRGGRMRRSAGALGRATC